MATVDTSSSPSIPPPLPDDGGGGDTSATIPPDLVHSMFHACSSGDLASVQTLVSQHPLLRSFQIDSTGMSPLMAASAAGYLPIVQFLLQQGAPWNALDRYNRCAGDHATQNQHWEIVNELVHFATKAELLLGAVIRNQREGVKKSEQSCNFTSNNNDRPVQEEPCTKPDYLKHRLQFSDTAILDQDRDAVMMEWERPLMEAHAQIMMESSNDQKKTKKTVMNIGFGMGIIDGILQQEPYRSQIQEHIIVEAHPDVYKRMLDSGWDHKPKVRICFGKWQDELPKLISERQKVDALFFDTYGEHFTDMEDFHQQMVPQLLSRRSDSVYSFFNGLAPDNLFFHGVACQCVKLQLEAQGLEAEFLQCGIVEGTREKEGKSSIMDEDTTWKGVRRKYWHGRDTYYLPRITWKQPSQEEEDKKQDAVTVTQETNSDKGGEVASRQQSGNSSTKEKTETHSNKRQKTRDDNDC